MNFQHTYIDKLLVNLDLSAKADKSILPKLNADIKDLIGQTEN